MLFRSTPSLRGERCCILATNHIRSAMSVRLAIDAMGGDHGLTVTVPAALSFLQSHPDAELLLVGRPDEVEGALQSSRQAGGHGSDPALSSRIRVVPASEVIRMDDNPVQALRNRRNFFMRIAIE